MRDLDRMNFLCTQVSKTLLCTGHLHLLTLEHFGRKILKRVLHSGAGGAASGIFGATTSENGRRSFSAEQIDVSCIVDHAAAAQAI